MVILGAGVAGLSAALECQRRGVSAVVLERGVIGSGASTRNAGFLMRGAADNYAAGVREFGRDLARSLWALSERNLASLVALGIDRLPTFERRPSCLLAMTEEESCELHRSVELMREDGFRAEILWKHGDAPWRNPAVRCGMLNPDDAVINPVDLLRHLASKLDRAPVEHAEVAEVDRSGEKVVVRTADLEVRAARMLVCLNGFVGRLFPEIAHWARPNRGQMLAVRAPAAEVGVSFAYYANHGYDYFRRVDTETVIVGGRRNRFEPHERTDSDATTDEVQRSLEACAEEMLGRAFPVTARWAGTMGFSPTGLPIVSAMPRVDGTGANPRAVFCGGFTGHGMSLGYETARHAVEVVVEGAASMMPAPPALPDV